MVLKGCLVSLLLLFLILFLVSSVGKSQDNYNNFLRQHVDSKRMTSNLHSYCQHKMKSRGLTSRTCVKKNTFIHARNGHIKVICGVGGRRINSTFSDSLASYIMTTCRSKGGSPPKRCRYRGRNERRRVRVACSRGVPVHLREILSPWP